MYWSLRRRSGGLRERRGVTLDQRHFGVVARVGKLEIIPA